MRSYKWKVEPVLTGRYKSFERRGFPHAYYDDEHKSPAAFIGSDEDYQYVPKQIKYKSLILRVADHSKKPWIWRKVVKKCETIQEAKELFEIILKKHPEIAP